MIGRASVGMLAAAIGGKGLVELTRVN
jgi:hypothetical protein